jgi:oxygen-independent coproporphyrinogen-3 oxidase
MYRVRLDFQKEDYLNDVQDVPRAFAPYLVVDENSPNYFGWDFSYLDGNFVVNINCDLFGNITKKMIISDDDTMLYKKYTKRFLKNIIYDYLSEKLNIVLPYGSLTGVRPTKLYYELNKRVENPKEYLISEFNVTKARADLIEDCVNNQTGIINTDDKKIGLFLNIPFCPTRCSYCTFISTEVSKVKKELPFFIENVLKEIEVFKEFLSKTDYEVSSVYVGGGTPTSIGVDMLNSLLEPLANFGVEFTVEAGRPDTINNEMLDMLKKNNVTRISINPQSFNQKTLDKIGRKHTIPQLLECFDYAKKLGFLINMDLIAMLQDETIEDFCYSVDRVIELYPQNITIHTLSLKRGSTMTIEGEKKQEFGLAQKMVSYAYDRLYNSGYMPYYMYRQKNMADNLENVGFCQKNCQCAYNIDMMEESQSIYGMGAGAISKLISGNGKIDRLSNPKGFREYCDRIESIVLNKKNFFNI